MPVRTVTIVRWLFIHMSGTNLLTLHLRSTLAPGRYARPCKPKLFAKAGGDWTSHSEFSLGAPCRPFPSPSKGMAGHGWLGPGARPSLTEPFNGYGRAWLGLIGLGREPDRALPNPSKGMAGHGWAWLGWAGSPTEPCRTLQRVWQGMVELVVVAGGLMDGRQGDSAHFPCSPRRR